MTILHHSYSTNGVRPSRIHVCITNYKTGSWSPLYDLDGNQTFVKTKTGDWFVAYNGENRPILWFNGVTNIVFSYDWLGRCVGRKILKNSAIIAESVFCYDGSLKIAEYVISGGHTSLVTRTFWDASQTETTRPLAMKTAQDLTFYYTVDVTKNICEIVSSNGDVVSFYDYAPFGEVSATNVFYGNSTLWASEQFEASINVSSYLKRDYEPTIGRWLTKDTIGGGSYNLYSYVNNQPVSKIDVLGFAIAESDCENALTSVLEGNMSGHHSEPGRRVEVLINAIRDDTNCHLPQMKCGCCDVGGQFAGSSRDSSGAITICANNISAASYVYGILVHELTHAYDSCKGTNFSKCEERACSEIRATIISGECQPGGAKRRLLPGIGGYLFEKEEECIKRNAMDSLKRTACIINANKYVNEAYENCANDMSPIRITK